MHKAPCLVRTHDPCCPLHVMTLDQPTHHVGRDRMPYDLKDDLEKTLKTEVSEKSKVLPKLLVAVKGELGIKLVSDQNVIQPEVNMWLFIPFSDITSRRPRSMPAVYSLPGLKHLVRPMRVEPLDS